MLITIGVVLIFAIWLRYEIAKNGRKSSSQSETFWDTETKSNFVRKKDISNLDYISVSLDVLPFAPNPDEEINHIQEEIKKLSSKKILNLSGKTNTEIKLTYGTANLNVLAEYDQNYMLLIRNLNKWGSLLYQRGERKDALKVLQYALECGTDISESFTLLANIYVSEKHPEKITELIEIVSKGNSLTKSATLNSLNTIYETAAHVQG